MRHQLKAYQDGYTVIEYCYKCGQEGLDLVLTPECFYEPTLICLTCGNKNCQCERKDAIDRTKLRN